MSVSGDQILNLIGTVFGAVSHICIQRRSLQVPGVGRRGAKPYLAISLNGIVDIIVTKSKKCCNHLSELGGILIFFFKSIIF